MNRTSKTRSLDGQDAVLERDAEQPLVRLLVAEAVRRGETLVELARALGVSYERLAQWRRHEADFANAKPAVIEMAAQYLGVPAILVWVMAGKLKLSDFAWPSSETTERRVKRELTRMRADPFWGGFVPGELEKSSPAIQLFVVFLFREATGQGRSEDSNPRWLRGLHLAVAGNLESRAEVDRLRQASGDDRIF